MPTETFTADGQETTWTVPDGVTELTITTWGAAGEDGSASGKNPDAPIDTRAGSGSNGGKATATVPVNPGDQVTVYIGERGSNGGYPDGGSGGYRSNNYESESTATADAGNGGGSTRVTVAGTKVIQSAGGGGGGALCVSHGWSDSEHDASYTVGDGGAGNGGFGGDSTGSMEYTGNLGTGDYYSSASADGGDNNGNRNGHDAAGSDNNGTRISAGAGGGGGGGNTTGEGGEADVAGDDATVTAAGASGGAGTAFFVSSATNTSTQDNVTSPDNGIDGQVTIEYEEPPDPITNLSVTAGSRECSLTWTNDPDDYDQIEIYRALSSGGTTTADYTLVDTISGTAESYTDTTASDDGEKYFYRVRGIFGGNSIGFSGEDSDLTNLPALTNLSVIDVRDSDADISWTASHNNGDTRIDVREDDSGSWVQNTTTANTTETATLSGLLNGKLYGVRVVAQTEHTETVDIYMPIQITTTLPDEDQPVLGNGVEDEVAVDRGSTVTNNGSIRIQIRETGQSSWDGSATGFGEFIGSFDTLTMEFVGREDGEEYEVRARSETAYRTGTWTDPVAITTKFPAVVNLVATAAGQTSIDLAWDDQADNEDGQEVIRERRAPDGDGWWPEETIVDAGVDATTYTDDMVQPGREYRYRVRAFTEHASAESTPDTATTDTTGLPTTRRKARGWDVRADLGDPVPRELSVVAGARWQGQLNDYPRAELPLPQSDVWRDRVGTPLTVSYDGTTLPLDEIADVETAETATTLTAEGATQLRRRISESVTSKAAHLVLEDLLTEHTDYVVDVDDPAAETILDELLQQADATGELQNRLRQAINDTDPFELVDGEIVVYNTGEVFEAEDHSSAGSSFNAPGLSGSGPESGQGQAARMSDVGDAVEKDVSLEYDVPDGEASIWVRQDDRFGNAVPDIEWFVDGASIGTLNIAGLGPWINVTDQLGYPGGLDAGTHTVRAEVVGTNGDDLLYDLIAVLDGRFEYTLPNTLQTGPNGGRWLDGPEAAPDALDLVFADVETPLSVVGARIEATLSGTGGDQQLAVSNDQGETYVTADNSETLDTTFAEPGGTLRLRVRLSRQGERDSTTPLSGFEPQSLDAYELFGDVEDTPVLVNWSDEGDLLNVAVGICEQSDFVLEARPAPDADGTDTKVIVTRPGLRESDADPSVVSYSDRVSVSNQTLACDVIGGRQSVSSERLTAQVGEWVSLGNSDLITGTEAVYDPDTGESFQSPEDYEIRPQEGEIRATSAGDLVDGAQYYLDYEYKPRGRYEDAAWDGDQATERVETIPGLTTRRGCQQAALRIVEELRDPYVEITAEWADFDPTQSLVESISLSALPGDGAYRVASVDGGVDGVSATLANQQQARDAIADIRASIQALSRRS